MISLKKIIKHSAIALITIVILIGTLFIPKSVNFPSREVRLGYPIHFFTLDFSGNRGSTRLSGAPGSFLKNTKFNVLSSWEEYTQISWNNLILSYLIIFFIFESAIFVLDRAVLQSKKSNIT